MVYPYIKYPDGTEVAFSDIRKDENGEETIWVSFERPSENCFDTIIFELPTYRIIKQEGNYTQEDIKFFKKMAENNSDLFYKYAKEGGLKFE